MGSLHYFFKIVLCALHTRVVYKQKHLTNEINVMSGLLWENVMQTAQETYLLHVIHVQINNYSVILDKECTTAATCGLH